VTVPLPVVMDKAFGNAGEKGTAGTILSSNWRSWGFGLCAGLGLKLPQLTLNIFLKILRNITKPNFASCKIKYDLNKTKLSGIIPTLLSKPTKSDAGP
jgi:hypothetical protein